MWSPTGKTPSKQLSQTLLQQTSQQLLKKMPHSILQYGVVACIIFAVVVTHSAGRNLRPSEHGLANQRDASSPAPNQSGDAHKMLSSFFSSTPPSTPLPEAQRISGGGGGDTWRSVRGGGGSRDLRSDHVRLGLIAAAAVCGFAGVVLLVVTGVVYHLRRRKEKAGAERFSSN